jgi:hypothetical protein
VPEPAVIAYFSMEVALESHIPTYSGGLGVLAGDTLRSAADLELALVGVTLIHRKGYFFQRLDRDGRQDEEPVAWPVDDLLQPTGGSCVVAGRSPSGLGAMQWRGPVARAFLSCCWTQTSSATIPTTAASPTTSTGATSGTASRRS